MPTKDIPPRERLIFALDVPTVEEARRLVDLLGDEVLFYKLGLELLMTGRYYELVEELRARGKKIMADLKFFDVPQTVGAAVRQLTGRGIAFATVHGNEAILEAACREKGEVKILAVTVLTSLDEGDVRDLGFETDVETLVLSRARRALAVGCDGVVSSGREAPAIKQEVGERLIVVVPGIRPVANRPVDDQKRTVSVAEAFERGADYVVIGRPIKNAPDPKAAARAIQAEIAGVWG